MRDTLPNSDIHSTDDTHCFFLVEGKSNGEMSLEFGWDNDSEEESFPAFQQLVVDLFFGQTFLDFLDSVKESGNTKLYDHMSLLFSNADSKNLSREDNEIAIDPLSIRYD